MGRTERKQEKNARQKYKRFDTFCDDWSPYCPHIQVATFQTFSSLVLLLNRLMKCSSMYFQFRGVINAVTTQRQFDELKAKVLLTRRGLVEPRECDVVQIPKQNIALYLRMNLVTIFSKRWQTSITPKTKGYEQWTNVTGYLQPLIL